MAEDVVRLLDHLKIRKAYFVGYSMGGMIVLKLAATHPERMEYGIVGGMGWLPKGPIVSPRTPTGRQGRSEAIRSCIAAFPDLGTTQEELKAIKVPLEIIIGADDDLLQRRVKPFEAIRPDVPVTIIPGANHLNCSFNSEFKQKIKDSLDKQTKEKK